MNQSAIAAIRHKLTSNQKVKPTLLKRYFALRDSNPTIKDQWDALTEVDSEHRTIMFPDGSTRDY